MKRYFVLFNILIGIAACTHPAFTEAKIFNSSLKQAYKNYQKTLFEKKDTLLFASGKTANNCAEYFSRRKTSTIAEGVNNQIIHQEYLICDSIHLLKKSSFDFSSPSAISYGKVLLKRLDLRSFPSSLGQMIEDDHVVLETLSNLHAHASQYAVISETPEWLFKIEIVATLDIDGNGKEDWLLWVTDKAQKGNYQSYQVLVVLNPAQSGLFPATPIHPS